MTVNGEIKFTFHPAAPIVDEETNTRFADALIEMLEIVAGVKDVPASESPLDKLPNGFLTKSVATIGAISLLSHVGSYASFFHSVMEMKAAVAPTDFWSAMNFWIFFAVGHVILEPVLWISDVLHGSPGPMVGGLVPATFLLGNIIAIGAVSYSKEVIECSVVHRTSFAIPTRETNHYPVFFRSRFGWSGVDSECCQCSSTVWIFVLCGSWIGWDGRIRRL